MVWIFILPAFREMKEFFFPRHFLFGPANVVGAWWIQFLSFYVLIEHALDSFVDEKALHAYMSGRMKRRKAYFGSEHNEKSSNIVKFLHSRSQRPSFWCTSVMMFEVCFLTWATKSLLFTSHCVILFLTKLVTKKFQNYFQYACIYTLIARHSPDINECTLNFVAFFSILSRSVFF